MVRKGTLNKLVDELLHPKIVRAKTDAEADGYFLLDLAAHFAVERDPVTSVLKAIKYGNPRHKKGCKKRKGVEERV